jgi:TatD DNase family protein
MYIDTHTHIHYKDFDQERKELIKKLTEQKIYTILIGTDLDTSQRAIDFTDEYEYSKATVGYHPNDHGEWCEEKWAQIVSLASSDKVVGIGETGIDLYRDQSKDNKSNQIELFHRHITLAQKLDKAVVIHSRDAFPEVEEVLKQYQGLRVVFHCYTGNRYWMERLSLLPHEVYFSYSGIITFKNKVEQIQEAAKYTPIERILTETDSPYLAPVPFRGKQNNSTLLPYVANFLADLREVGQDEFKSQIFQNAQSIFKKLT